MKQHKEGGKEKGSEGTCWARWGRHDRQGGAPCGGSGAGGGEHGSRGEQREQPQGMPPGKGPTSALMMAAVGIPPRRKAGAAVATLHKQTSRVRGDMLGTVGSARQAGRCAVRGVRGGRGGAQQQGRTQREQPQGMPPGKGPTSALMMGGGQARG